MAPDKFRIGIRRGAKITRLEKNLSNPESILIRQRVRLRQFRPQQDYRALVVGEVVPRLRLPQYRLGAVWGLWKIPRELAAPPLSILVVFRLKRLPYGLKHTGVGPFVRGQRRRTEC